MSVRLSVCLSSVHMEQLGSHWTSSSSVICQKTGPKPLPKQFLHIVRSRASSFNWQYPLLSWRSSSSFLHLLPRLLITSICRFIFPSITCCRRQFLRKMWPIQLAFRFLISCRIFLCSLTLSNTSSFLTRSVQLIFSILLQHHISKLSRPFWSVARSIQFSAPYSFPKTKFMRTKQKYFNLHITNFYTSRQRTSTCFCLLITAKNIFWMSAAKPEFLYVV